jgi:hypothetical protein
MKKGLIGCGIALVVVLVIVAMAVAGSYNRLVKLEEGVKSAWGQVENVYQRRADEAEEGHRSGAPLPLGGRGRLAAEDPLERAGHRDDAAGVVPGGEAGLDGRRQDAARDRVRDLVLQAVPDLEAHLPVVQEGEEDHAVVEPLAPDLPRLGAAHREVLERLALERGHEDRDHLVAGALLDGRQAGIGVGERRRSDHAGEVGEVAARRRRHLECRRRRRDQAERGAEPGAHRARTAPSAPGRSPARPGSTASPRSRGCRPRAPWGTCGGRC